MFEFYVEALCNQLHPGMEIAKFLAAWISVVLKMVVNYFLYLFASNTYFSPHKKGPST